MAENTGNSQITDDALMDEVANSVMDDSNFFDDLEESVNGTIADPGTDAPQRDEQVTRETTPQQVAPDSVETDTVDWDSDANPYKKRYADSSRENTKNQEYIQDNQKYNAILDVMKKDPGLVDNVRQYLQNGGKPQSMKDALNLDEDFIFDPDEAFSDPNSKSAAVFSNAVNRMVDAKIKNTENKVANAMQADNTARNQRTAAKKWMKDNNMSEKNFADMMNKANAHTISYDDINLILNKDKFAKNVASNSKKDIQSQVKAARANATPNVVAGGNADTTELTVEDQIFDSLKNLDAGDTLFDS